MYFVEMFMCGADVVLVMKSTLCMGHKPRECQRGVLHAPSVFRVGVALVVVKVNVFNLVSFIEFGLWCWWTPQIVCMM